MACKNLITPAEVLTFWFGSEPWAVRGKLWWQAGPEVDEEIIRRFGPSLPAARNGALMSWCFEATGTLALIVLLDQMHRHAYRGTADAFAGDEMAQSVCRTGLADQQIDQLHPLGAAFFLMPLEHAENLQLQDESVFQFRRLVATAAGQASAFEDYLRNTLDHAVEHRNIIAEFGRFPHRNAILNRPSTDAEIEFLTNSGKTYGQQAKK